MKYFIVFSKESVDINNSSGLVFRTICKNIFFKKIYSVYDHKNDLLFTFEKKNYLFFFSNPKIVANNLNYDFFYYKKGQTFFLNLKNDLISYQGKFMGYLNSKFVLNNKIIGYIKEEYEFPNNKISFIFSEDNEMIYNCLLLFIISSTAFWDPN